MLQWLRLCVLVLLAPGFFLLSCGREHFEEEAAAAPTDSIVTVTGRIVNFSIDGIPIDAFDPIANVRVPLRLRESKIFADSTFRATFAIDRPQMMLFFLKEVWVTPGDSVHVEFRVLENSPSRWRDTLLTQGEYAGNYGYYPFFRIEYRFNEPGFPNFYLQKKYADAPASYKEDLRRYFQRKSAELETYCRKHALTPEAAARIRSDHYYDYLITLATPYTSGQVKKEDLPATYFDDFRDSLFTDSSRLDSRYFCQAFRIFHQWRADDGRTAWFSPAHFQALYEDAARYPGRMGEFLHWTDVDWYAKHRNQSFRAPEVAVTYQNIVRRVQSPDFSRRMADSGFAELLDESPSLTPALRQVELVDFSGNKLYFGALLERYAGKVVYLDFWASWCKPCREEFPYTGQLKEHYRDAGVAFVYISQDRDEKGWRRAVESERLNPADCYLLRSKEQLAVLSRELQFTAIPHYALVAPDGSLAYLNAPRPSAQGSVRQAIDGLLP